MPILNPITKQIRYINKIPYIINAQFFISSVKDPNGIKKALGCTTAFKNTREGVYLFCTEIEEAEIIKDVDSLEIPQIE